MNRCTEVDGICEALEIPGAAIEPRGRQVVKIEPAAVPFDRKGRVVLVTALTPTPAGEGKTTTAVGLVDGLSRIGVRAIGALREPSLGPLMGLKGGAIGGGAARLVPAEQINLHFTGDLHAVTSAHNLLSAMLDNHLHFGGSPSLEPAAITWGRVLDMNDRALRRITLRGSKKAVREDRFDITAASEVMAVLCMASDPADLVARLGRIVVGLDVEGRPVTARDLGADGAMAALLVDAMRPNLVRTLEDNPVLVHGGPFANIAQGTSTLIGTRLARRLADVVITEAGFAFDLGGFKFLDLKCRAGGFLPADIVLVVTVRALRHHGGVDHAAGPDAAAVERGLENVAAHLDAIERLGLPAPLLAVNLFGDEADDELKVVTRFADARGTQAVPCDGFARGGAGAEALAAALMGRLEGRPAESTWRAAYDLKASLPVKIEGVARTVFGATGVELTERAQADLALIERMNLGDLPVCLAKTHLS
ncbi:MAG: formate--tetrahydrofolate ligase, partial [Myxococcales bacterium]|nr:formate--tetrahydrofolate ligase [Myxococcales bacterium]